MNDLVCYTVKHITISCLIFFANGYLFGRFKPTLDKWFDKIWFKIFKKD